MSDPEKGRFTPDDKELAADDFLMFLAGTDKTACFRNLAYIVVPEIERKLVAELRHAMSDKNAMAKCETLETLPYLVSPVCVLQAHSYSWTISSVASSKKLEGSLMVLQDERYGLRLHLEPPYTVSRSHQE